MKLNLIGKRETEESEALKEKLMNNIIENDLNIDTALAIYSISLKPSILDRIAIIILFLGLGFIIVGGFLTLLFGLI